MTTTFTTYGDPFRRLTRLLEPLADEYVLTFDADGLHTAAVDPANIGMVELSFPRDVFEEFETDGETEFGLRLDRFRETTRFVHYGRGDSEGDRVEFAYDGGAKATIRVTRDDLNRYTSFGMIDPDSVRSRPDIPDLPLSWAVDVDAGTLAEVLHAFPSDQVRIGVDSVTSGVDGPSGGVYLAGESDTVHELTRLNAAAEWIGDGDPSALSSLFSIDYLKDMAEGLNRAKADSVRLKFGEEVPITVAFSDSTYGYSGQFMLAPRVPTDEAEGESGGPPDVMEDLFRDYEGETNTVENDAPEVSP